MRIRVLGSGCASCRTLASRTREAIAAEGIDGDVVEEHDPVEIAMTGIVSTPALEVDGEIVTAGSVPDVSALRNLLRARPT